MKYFDIHTHHERVEADTTAVRNLSLSEANSLIFDGRKGFYSVGIHPWYADNVSVEDYVSLEAICRLPQIVMIGECGFDKYAKADIETQTAVFQRQIELSESLSKPLIIHCVGRFNELILLKKRINPKMLWIIHGFRGKPQLAEQLLKDGIALSYGFKYNEKSVELTPLDCLFLETDETPEPINKLYEQIANLKHCKIENISAGKKLFN